MKRFLQMTAMAMVAATGMATNVQAGAFGLFPAGRYCSQCSICFRPYNAFTPVGPGGGCGMGCGMGHCSNSAGYYFGDTFANGPVSIPPVPNPWGACAFGNCGHKSNNREYLFQRKSSSTSSTVSTDGCSSCGEVITEQPQNAKSQHWFHRLFARNNEKKPSAEATCDGCGVPGEIFASTPVIGSESISGEIIHPTPAIAAPPAAGLPAPSILPSMQPVPAQPATTVAPPRMEPVSYQQLQMTPNPQMIPQYYGTYGYGYYPAFQMPTVPYWPYQMWYQQGW